ncbi:CGNR zinc finger domain-containing protein [Nocardioidaceae bacterium SCSIO 66511]|nr:CGNR zinc finger domain-containing protein [Nocardioidaceae bacterium SCSIO 66511]
MLADPATTVLAFLNTLDVEDGTDLISDPDEWQQWVSTTLDLDEEQTPPRRDKARELRALLRAAVSAESDAGRAEVPVSVELGPRGGRIRSSTAIGTIAAAVAKLSIDGRWHRVKICPADDCRWAFFDESRNRSRQWCSMSVCGNRAKVRKHRERTTS